MQRMPICQGCFNADLKAIPLRVDGEKQKLWHCANCEKSYWLRHGRPEEIKGLALLCATLRRTPENCDPAIRRYFPLPQSSRGDALPHPPDPSYLRNIREADAVCIRCHDKNFVIGSN